MTINAMIELYKHGKNHQEIATMHYTSVRMCDKTYAYSEAEREVIEAILEHCKRKGD